MTKSKRGHSDSGSRGRKAIQPAGKQSNEQDSSVDLAEDATVAAKPASPTEGKALSAVNAAALVLAEAGLPLHCQQLIEAMRQRSLWTSPNGRTPQATLYAALMREIKVRGSASRFQRVARGQFVLVRPA